MKRVNKGGCHLFIMEDENKLLHKIEKTREQMMLKARQKGFQHEEVISLSQKLDKLLNKFETLKKE
ncbi:MAG TPA: aspartyl-phosphate phosphatase Spo0E family protein [Bacillota bacterium]|nr:aspartyl-phosphate phosphatase Spo0E family protein [Bacillota bacterium]